MEGQTEEEGSSEKESEREKGAQGRGKESRQGIPREGLGRGPAGETEKEGAREGGRGVRKERSSGKSKVAPGRRGAAGIQCQELPRGAERVQPSRAAFVVSSCLSR